MSDRRYGAQTEAHEYQAHSYRKQERWDSFWHQIDLVRKVNPVSVLEVGPGPGVVTRALRDAGIHVTTVDVADDVGADVVCSVTELPFPNQSFDLVLAAEILEHIRAEDVSTALGEIARVARTGAVISVPTPGASLLLDFKLPLIGRYTFFQKVPFFWKVHQFDGQHYWELDTKGRPFSWFVSEAKKVGLGLTKSRIYPDAPYHRFFVFTKQ